MSYWRTELPNGLQRTFITFHQIGMCWSSARSMPRSLSTLPVTSIASRSRTRASPLASVILSSTTLLRYTKRVTDMWITMPSSYSVAETSMASCLIWPGLKMDPSDIREDSVDYWYVKESLVVLGRGIDSALSRTALIFAFKNTGRSKMLGTYLLFLINTYRETLPNLSVLVVEQDTKPKLSKDRLPSGCQYHFLNLEGDFDQQRCWKTGLNLALEKEFVVFSDPDVYLQRLDMCGNVRICERYDVATGFFPNCSGLKRKHFNN